MISRGSVAVLDLHPRMHGDDVGRHLARVDLVRLVEYLGDERRGGAGRGFALHLIEQTGEANVVEFVDRNDRGLLVCMPVS